MEINLLEHSTYNVEKIRENQKFFDMLMSKIKQTYKIFRYKETDQSNNKRIEFAPTSSRITNVFIKLNSDGNIEFTFCGGSILNKIKGNYEILKFPSLQNHLTIKGVNVDNYKEHLPAIVKAIEYCDYSFA